MVSGGGQSANSSKWLYRAWYSPAVARARRSTGSTARVQYGNYTAIHRFLIFYCSQPAAETTTPPHARHHSGRMHSIDVAPTTITYLQFQTEMCFSDDRAHVSLCNVHEQPEMYAFSS